MFTRLLSILIGALALAVGATPPPNDLCSGTELIPTNGPFPYLTAITDLKDATTNSDPAAPSCVFGSVNRGVWYRFTPPATALYTIACSGDTATTVQDTVMAIYTSANGCAGPFTEVDCNDDAGDLQSAISRTLNADVPYYILISVSGASAPLGSNTNVQLRVSRPAVPGNDTCAGAEIIPPSGPFPHLSSVVDTTLATTTSDPPAPSCWVQNVRSVWFKFTPGTTATYELTLCTNTATTIYETLLAVYTTASPCASFTQIACNHTTPCGNVLRSTITTPLTNGVTYYIVGWEGVDDVYIPGETSLQLRVNRYLAPTVSTLSAYGLTSTSAVLQASVTPNAATTFAWFQYGLTTNYGSATAPANLGAATGPLGLQSTVGSLTPGAVHHFRVVASNSIGTSFGVNRTFAWSSTPPQFTEYYETNSGFALRFDGQSAQLYVVESSTNLLNWTSLGLATELGGGWFQLIAPDAAPQQFFRVMAP